MKNREIADFLKNMGTLLEIQGENVFKIRAYYKASDNILALGEDIEHVKNENRLSDIPGIGKELDAKICEWLETGNVKAYKKLTKEVPETLLDVVRIPSVGPKKAKLFFDELKVKSPEDLLKAAKRGSLLELPSVKEKTVENIIKGIEIVQQGQERMNLGTATRVADEMVLQLKKLKGVKRIEIAGSLRRGRETVRDIDILIDARNSQIVMDAFVAFPQVKKINAHGETKSSIVTDKNIQIDLRIVDPECFGATLLYFTGSKNFNVKLRQIAIKKKMKVNEYGIFKVKGKKEECVASKTEKACFKALGLNYVPPELREDIGESELFDHDKICTIPTLIEQKDIKGDFHVHSTWSDGKNSIEEMAVKAKSLGYQYLAISDHSMGLKIARGLSPDSLKKKRKEVDVLNKKNKNFRILMGAEVEIDSQGNIDYNNDILKSLDVVVASIHSGFEQSQEQLTNRLVKAIENKYVNIIAHPTGVHLGKRKPYKIDFKEVCQAAVKNNVFLEINAFPIRLDLESSNVYYARKCGVKFVVNTDAHRCEHMDYMKFGISIARRGWLTKKDVLNTMPLAQILKALNK